ncbi:MAG: hypothetical protein ACOC44_18810 [Promethearchaeia archaeon]
MPVRKVVKQSSGVYTITIPKDIIESKKWENAKFDIKLENGKIILEKVED